ncbi:permease-like cell division protein FtsX [Vibrio sp. SCSIO 43137]|uniref:permease-like cell division protein FtsX n=1 Tax=Vibrio sp. SCSIO 43137 TaxID=3021011 RepID=UPI002FE2BAE9
MASNSRAKAAIVHDGFVKVHVKQLRASFFALWQRPLGNILTLAVIAVALALPACGYLIGKNIAKVAEGVTTPSNVSLYVQEGTPEARIMVLKDQIENWPSVASVKYISSQQGLNDLSEYSGFEQAISLLNDYALPAVLVVQPAVDSNSEIRKIASQSQQLDIVTDVRLDEDWLARLNAIQNLAIVIATTSAVLMLGAVFLIVGNTLRFTVLAHKEEIQVMKLIGATDGFILRPYLYSGMWFGVIGALAAWILTAVITILLNGAVEDLAMLYDSQFRLMGLNWDESLLLLMTGVLLGFVAARFSARKHLKEIEPV